MVSASEYDWGSLPGRPDIESGAVHLVAVSCPESQSIEPRDMALLTEAEQTRAKRFRVDQHRARWVFGRVTLKRLLGRYLDCPSSDVSFAYGAVGKPRLATPSGQSIEFNYTDSRGHLIYAFSRQYEVGIDLECLPRKTRHESLAARKLTSIEQMALSRVAASEREYAFLASWTRKEAYGKAIGVGIRYPLNQVTLCNDFSSSDYATCDEDGGPILLQQFTPPFSGIACIAARATSFSVESFCAFGPSK